MKNNNLERPPPVATPYNISLIKYENPPARDLFNMTTVHSMLIDQDQRFIKLKHLVNQYNNKQLSSNLGRPQLDRKFIAQLYKMLCELVRICHLENQQAFLNKIYNWAFKLQGQEQQLQQLDDRPQEKLRPTTASTKARPYSAHTRKTRPDSGVPTKYSIAATKNSQEDEQISEAVMEKYPYVDFKELKHGQKQFFLGHRTFHPEIDKPKKRLKQFHRKVLYNEDDEQQNKFQEFFQEQDTQMLNIPFHKEVPVKEPLKQLVKEQPKVLDEQKNPKLNEQGVPVQENQAENAENGKVGEEDVNIDDLIGGDMGGDAGGEDEGIVQEEQQQEIIDKLAPRVKPYKGDPKGMSRNNTIKFYERLQSNQNQRNKLVRNNIEDDGTGQMMRQWGRIKSQIKTQQKRRSESSKLVHPHIGIQFNKDNTKTQSAQRTNNIMDFTDLKISETKSGIRPKTAYRATSQKVYQQKIENAITSGNLNEHLKLLKKHNDPKLDEEQLETNVKEKYSHNNWIKENRNERIVSVGAKPKKKTFEQILQEAEQKVEAQMYDEVDDVKEKLTRNNIALNANKIKKSLTYHMNEVEEMEFVGQITGKNMLNNPFFKVAKKKKKKKKKK